ncbi:hypothetical protein NKH77_55915 [Streptomyces sp. M19]
MSATGEPALVQEDTQVRVGIDLRPGTLTLTRNGTEYAVYHALVQFASARAKPWVAEEVEFSATGRTARPWDCPWTSSTTPATAPGRHSCRDLEGRGPRRDLRRRRRHHLRASWPRLIKLYAGRKLGNVGNTLLECTVVRCTEGHVFSTVSVSGFARGKEQHFDSSSGGTTAVGARRMFTTMGSSAKAPGRRAPSGRVRLRTG